MAIIKRSSKEFSVLQPRNKVSRNGKADTKNPPRNGKDESRNSPVLSLRSSDVICGRGCGRHSKAEGNRKFHELVKSMQDVYDSAPKKRKSAISKTVVDRVRSQKGRFIYKHPRTQRWAELSYKKSIEKTSQTFRDYRTKDWSVSLNCVTTPQDERQERETHPVETRPSSNEVENSQPACQQLDVQSSQHPNRHSVVEVRSQQMLPHPYAVPSNDVNAYLFCEENLLQLPLFPDTMMVEDTIGLNLDDMNWTLSKADALHFFEDDDESSDEQQENIPHIPSPPEFVSSNSFMSSWWDKECCNWIVVNDIQNSKTDVEKKRFFCDYEASLFSV
jgi:hypothetical protein